MEKTHTYIESSLSKRKGGDLVFPADFKGKGTDSAIKKALSRLEKKKKLKRLSHGIYYIPRIDPVFGEIYPALEEVAENLAKREKVRIRPAGAYALHKLGLSAQVPTRLVYITDGTPRHLRIGKAAICFKATTPKKLSAKGKISGLLIQALEELDIMNIDPETEKKFKTLLRKEKPRQLKYDLALAPARIHDYILQLLKQDL